MMKPELDPAAQSALAEYLARLDAVLPGGWVYLTGSAALGDWLPGHSDLDILVVTGSAPARSWRAGRGVRTIGLMGFT